MDGSLERLACMSRRVGWAHIINEKVRKMTNVTAHNADGNDDCCSIHVIERIPVRLIVIELKNWNVRLIDLPLVEFPSATDRV